MSGKGYDFYREFTKRFSSLGQMKVWTFTCEGTMLGYMLNFYYAGNVFYYNGAYRASPQSLGNISAGGAILASAIRDACDNGFNSYDFLRGDEPYKLLWAKESRELFHTVLYKPVSRSIVAYLLVFRVRWFLRKYLVIHKIRQRFQKLLKSDT